MTVTVKLIKAYNTSEDFLTDDILFEVNTEDEAVDQIKSVLQNLPLVRKTVETLLETDERFSGYQDIDSVLDDYLDIKFNFERNDEGELVCYAFLNPMITFIFQASQPFNNKFEECACQACQASASHDSKLIIAHARSEAFKNNLISHITHPDHPQYIKQVLDTVKDYDNTKSLVDAPAAYGDTYKYIVIFRIGEHYFQYQHLLGEEMIYSKFEISESSFNEETTKGEVIYSYNSLQAMRNFFEEKSSVIPYSEFESSHPILYAFLSSQNACVSADAVSKYFVAMNYIIVFTIGESMSLIITEDTVNVSYTSLNMYGQFTGY